MKAFCEFLFCGLAYRYDLSCEMEGLAGHLAVEVHHDALILDFDHACHYDAALSVEHLKHVSRE